MFWGDFLSILLGFFNSANFRIAMISFNSRFDTDMVIKGSFLIALNPENIIICQLSTIIVVENSNRKTFLDTFFSNRKQKPNLLSNAFRTVLKLFDSVVAAHKFLVFLPATGNLSTYANLE